MDRHAAHLASSPRGFYVPRWLATALAGAVMLWFGWGMVREPRWVIQRLESPDGRYTARLTRVMYVRQYWQVELQRGWARQRVFQSGALPEDFRNDLRERLLWSEAGDRLYLSVEGRLVWGLDPATGNALTGDELALAQDREAARICR